MGPGDLQPTRIAAHPKGGGLFVLCLNGDLWQVDPVKGDKRVVLPAETYMKAKVNYLQALGLHIDPGGQFYIVVNERHDEDSPVRSHVVVYRGRSGPSDPAPIDVAPYIMFDHPWGIGPFNHGACRISIGPEGLLYLGVGSRTDHGERGKDPRFDPNGETFVTAAILRFDPKLDKPGIEVFARGLRNPFGFDWDDQGRLFAGENGPDADHPEELNWIRLGRHYGFPYRFGCDEHPMYVDAVPAPENLVFERPVANLGPDQLVGGKVTHTFPPHAAPTGMIFYREGELPARFKGQFFVTLFGNYLGKEPTGFALVTMKIVESEGRLAAETHNFLTGLRRPIDLCQLGGRLYLLEYIKYDDQRLPRILEIAGEK
ncbi:MAG TPA: PQQ-dependent sugar dehydrogenase [Planctomycetota bacterium]|nr:PQQ-dependent sugar dehydrogenase [Planctomycetota bacterium]